MGYYIIKTNEGEYVKVYAVLDFYSEPKEFSEFTFTGRRWKAHEVEVVEYPDKHGHQTRTYKYIGVELPNLDKKYKKKMLIGITGKSGSGKTTLAKWLGDNTDYHVIDVDEIGHKILDDPEVRRQIKEKFGVDVTSTDRKALGEIVFNNRDKMKEYADLTYQRMCDEIDNQIEWYGDCIIEWILLPKTKYFDQCDTKILCKRSYENRLKAVMERDGIGEEYFKTRESNSIEYDEEKFDKIIIINK